MIGLRFDELFPAQVVDDQDPLFEGRVKIFVPTIMQGWKSDHLPWARAFSNTLGGDFRTGEALACYNDDPGHAVVQSGPQGSSDIPVRGSYVWVWFSDKQFFKSAYYITGMSGGKNSPHNSLQKFIKPMLLPRIDVPISFSYPDTKFLYMPNGSAYFKNAQEDLPETGWVFSPDMYFMSREDRRTENATSRWSQWRAGTNAAITFTEDEISSTSKITLGNGDDAEPNEIVFEKSPATTAITLKSGTAATEKMCLAETLKGKLEDLVDALQAGVLPSPMGPIPFNSLSTWAQIQQFKTELTEILSENIKNN